MYKIILMITLLIVISVNAQNVQIDTSTVVDDKPSYLAVILNFGIVLENKQHDDGWVYGIRWFNAIDNDDPFCTWVYLPVDSAVYSNGDTLYIGEPFLE